MDIERHCKLRNIDVTMLEDDVHVVGNKSKGDSDLKCESKESPTCENLNCMYTNPEGIGSKGTVNPFE